MKSVVFGLCGLGGYAAAILRFLERDSALVDAPVKLTSVCEPAQQLHAQKIAELQARGIKVFSRYEDLLAEPIEAVWLPLPIHLHLPFTQQALAAGKAVMCEKPITGTIDDLTAMITARDQARLPTAVAFQDIYEPATHAMKTLLLDGTLGPVRSVTVRGLWPRDSQYYARNAWAGKLKIGQTWVLDSPANNAMAHYIMLPLFLLGETYDSADTPVSIEAELYRANPIENYDTCALRIQTAKGASMLVLFSHASEKEVTIETVIHCQRGTMRCRVGEAVEVIMNDGTVRRLDIPNTDRAAMVRRFARLVRGVEDRESHLATLEVAKSHLIATNGASEATPVRTIPESFATQIKSDDRILRAVPGIDQLFDACVAKHQLPDETGLAEWTVPAGKRDLRGYNHFAGPAA